MSAYNRIWPAVAAASFLSTPAFAGALPFTPEVVKLENGLTLVMVKLDSPGLVAYDSLVRVGSRDEVEKGVTGFAHFFEHMMFRGTDAWSPERVQKFLKKAGADQNGFTTDDFTCFTYFGRSDVLAELVEMEADRFKNLKYPEPAFKTESQAVLGEYNKSASNPSMVLEEKLRALPALSRLTLETPAPLAAGLRARITQTFAATTFRSSE